MHGFVPDPKGQHTTDTEIHGSKFPGLIPKRPLLALTAASNRQGDPFNKLCHLETRSKSIAANCSDILGQKLDPRIGALLDTKKVLHPW